MRKVKIGELINSLVNEVEANRRLRSSTRRKNKEN
ncbi:Uncharacterised protein [Klebsiella pneumoniae]|nr:Uncharacterised protein [Klebsiella pneumoniae]